LIQQPMINQQSL